MTDDQLFAVRDPLGVRPLCLGRIGQHWVIASESAALMTIGARFEREVAPGEIVEIGSEGLFSHGTGIPEHHALCLFELIYFARPDSEIKGDRLHMMRQRMGAELAKETPVDADVVIGLPDSATPAAIGYARYSGIPYQEALIKNRYIGRTFIQPDQRLRATGVSLKFNVLPEAVEGKRVVLVDDTIVRGTTSGPVVNLIRQAGAKEVHMRVHAPADDLALLSRRRSGKEGRTHCRQDDGSGDWPAHWRRLDRVSFAGGPVPGNWQRRAGILHWLPDW
jgi:amidophosphoribosyltransferase